MITYIYMHICFFWDDRRSNFRRCSRAAGYVRICEEFREFYIEDMFPAASKVWASRPFRIWNDCRSLITKPWRYHPDRVQMKSPNRDPGFLKQVPIWEFPKISDPNIVT